MATLTEATTWRIRFVLRGLPTTKGKKVDEIFNVECQFMEEDGYEPPQGYLKQVKVTTGEDGEAEDKQRFQIVESRWQLSEDPNDRKWGKPGSATFVSMGFFKCYHALSVVWFLVSIPCINFIFVLIFLFLVITCRSMGLGIV